MAGLLISTLIMRTKDLILTLNFQKKKSERICPKEEYSWDVQGAMDRPAVMLLSFDFQLGDVITQDLGE